MVLNIYCAEKEIEIGMHVIQLSEGTGQDMLIPHSYEGVEDTLRGHRVPIE